MNGFHHVAMKVFDFDKVVAFYTEGLGFEKGISWGEGANRAVMIDVGGDCCLEIFAGGKQDENAEATILHIAFKSSNCDDDLARAVKAGAVVEMDAESVDIPSNPIKPVRIAFCKGLGGEIIEFFEEK